MSARQPQHRRDPEAAIADWVDRPVGAIIDHILSCYHPVAWRQLAELRELSAAAGLDGALADRVARFDEAFSEHLRDEERVAFPTMRAESGRARDARTALEHDHLHIERLLGELRGALPEGCERSAARAQLGALLAEMEADLAPHATLEELLFARVAAEGS